MSARLAIPSSTINPIISVQNQTYFFPEVNVGLQIPGLIDLFSGVHPGYHMNKRHWITVDLDGSVPDGEIAQLIDQSYALVVGGLRVKERKALELKWGREMLYGQTSEAWPSPASNR